MSLGLDRRELAAIYAGGMLGALARVGLAQAFPVAAGSWPWTTLAVNVSGCFLLAYLATRLQERLPQSSYRRPLSATGFCGAFTTFSTVQVEIVRMLDGHHYGLAVAYAAVSVGAGFASVWLATAVVRRIRLAT